MSDLQYDEFLGNIINSLNKNGYPDKRVGLPLERMYEVAYQKGLNFNKALTLLAERGIAHEKTAERVVFFPKVDASTTSFQDMMTEAQKAVEAMSPQEREELMKMYQSMTAEQKADIASKAKDMGLS